MPGFYITNLPAAAQVRDDEKDDPYLLTETAESDGFSLRRTTRRQFLDDKLFMAADTGFLILEGVILNKRELMAKNNDARFSDTVLRLMRDDPDTFFSAFEGMFSGAVYDRNEHKWRIFADQTGNRTVFYYCSGDTLIAGSDLKFVSDTMALNGIARRVDENGIKLLLKYGCFMDDSTGISTVKRIYPGDYIVTGVHGAETRNYHSFCEDYDDSVSDDEAIAALDSAFKAAMRRAIAKNAEYGYENLIDISGGADSRMIAFTAKAIGCEDAVLAHYSQRDSFDDEISAKTAKMLDYEMIYAPLDDAKFLREIDEITLMNSGTAYFCGITGGKRLLKTLSGRGFGLEFTGLLGNMFDGGMLTQFGGEEPNTNHGQYLCTHLLDEVPTEINTLSRFRYNDLFWQYSRGMIFGMSTFFTRQNYIEPYTPFGDLKFFQVWLSTSWKRKVESLLLLKWMDKEYPQATAIAYAHTGMSLKSEFRPFAKYTKWLYAHFLAVQTNFTHQNRYNMNPFAQWEKEKAWLMPTLREYYDDSFTRFKSSPAFSDEIGGYIEKLFCSDETFAKYSALTVLSYYKNFIL